MKVVILAGGHGTRLSEETVAVPKPMLPIGGRPILWHIMKLYAAAGFREFVVALGYRQDVVKNYFLSYGDHGGDISVDLGANTVERRHRHEEDWRIHLVDTGLDTLTGGRVRRLAQMLAGEPFLLTYGDGVSDVPIADVVAFHRAAGRLGTITAVRPPARFGAIAFSGNEVTGFAEKRQTDEGWINGGFMVLEPGIFDYLHGDADVLETDLLERLAKAGELGAYRHPGFWQCMDTLRDRQFLDELWRSGRPPWRVWDG